MLQYNLEHGFQFFRISSDIVPFASHAVNTYPWQKQFGPKLSELGAFVRSNGMRVSMHPDQFVLINSPSEDIYRRSVDELLYHADILELMELDTTHKLQIHVGGVYADKPLAVERFAERYALLPERIRARLVIENDDRSYSLADCLLLSKKTGIPILFDTFHHECLNNGESFETAFAAVSKTWKQKDGDPVMDYSSQDSEKRKGAHAPHLDPEDFAHLIPLFKKYRCSVMLEIKDKEKSAEIALQLVNKTK